MKKDKIKCDTSENWAKAHFIPKKDEIIVYSDLHKIKIGDGVHRINELDFSVKEDEKYSGNFTIIKEEK